MKYHSLKIYVLTSAEKTQRNSIWWAVLVGRYPSGYKVICILNRGASMSRHALKKIKRGTAYSNVCEQSWLYREISQ